MTDYASKSRDYDAREQKAIADFMREALKGNAVVSVKGGMLRMRADDLISALENALGRDVIERDGGRA